MASVKTSKELIEAIIFFKRNQYQNYKRLGSLFEMLQANTEQLTSTQISRIANQYIYKLFHACVKKQLSLKSFSKLTKILKIHKLKTPHKKLNKLVLSYVEENKHKAFYLFCTLIKIKKLVDGDTISLQEIYLKKYVFDHIKKQINSVYLSIFAERVPYSRDLLAKYILKYNYTDEYGTSIPQLIDLFCPGAKKYLLMS